MSDPAKNLSKCHLCQLTCTFKHNLVKHYRVVHQIEPPDTLKAQPAPKKQCPHCASWYVRLDEHLQTCKVLKGKVRTSSQISPPATAADDKRSKFVFPAMNTSFREAAASGASSPGHKLTVMSLQEALSSSPVRSVIKKPNAPSCKLLEEFSVWCESSDGGNMAKNSARLYCSKVNSLAEFERSRDPSFLMDLVGEIGWMVDGYRSLPKCGDWADTFKGFSNKSLAINAYLKLVDFLQSKLVLDNDRLDILTRMDRELYLKERRKEASKISKNVSSQIPIDRMENEAQREAFLGLNEVSNDEMGRLIKLYFESEQREAYYQELEKMPEGRFNAVEARDFLALELIVSSGARPGAAFNMTHMELFSARIAPTNPDKRVISVMKHKTAATHGSQDFIVSLRLVNIIKKFTTTFFEELNGKPRQSSKDPIFIRHGGHIMEHFEASVAIFRRITKTKEPIIGKSFRRYYASLGQDSEDPHIRENLPKHMGHSRETALRSYVRKGAEVKDYDEILSKIVNDPVRKPAMTLGKAEAEAEAKIREEGAAEAASKLRQKGPERRTATNFFLSAERELIMRTFKHVDKDNLPKAEVDKAIAENEEFEDLFQSFFNEGYSRAKFTSSVMNSFRAQRRKKS